MNWGFPEFRLRQVALGREIRGKLYLSHLPGRCGDEASPQRTFANDQKQIADASIASVVCLLDTAEIERKSIGYLWAINAGTLPWQTRHFPIADFAAPAADALRALADEIARELHSGSNVLIHCAAGIGRTGTVATAVLLALGASLAEAMTAVQSAGSGAETDEQRSLLYKLALDQ
ncbi:MAG TPA: tyrosine-protein phosphatase [Polyangiaceae bacterium]|nr:tyrosine-protein phosphatase [Polyangiaceae bacterium]